MIAILTTVICLVSCKDKKEPESKPETPAEAMEAIISLIQAKDYEALIRTRYAEIGKANGEAQIQTLIDRMRTTYEADENAATVIANYREALAQVTAVSATDEVVDYSISTGVVKLSRMPDGNWGFHL